MSVFTLASATRSSIIDAVSAERSSTLQWLKVVDNLQADGIKSHMIATEKKGGKVEIRESVRDAVTMGFTKTEQALLKKEAKSLDDTEKATKRYVQQQVGSMLGHIERLLAKAEAKAEDGTPKQATTKWSRFQDQLNKMMDEIQNSDGVADLHPADAIRTIKVLKGYLPKV
jgi:hypothetical protein